MSNVVNEVLAANKTYVNEFGNKANSRCLPPVISPS